MANEFEFKSSLIGKVPYLMQLFIKIYLQTLEEQWFSKSLFEHTHTTHVIAEMLSCSHSGGVWVFIWLVIKQISHAY